MRISHILLSVFVVLLGAAGVRAELIPADRLVPWAPGVTVGVPGGIPTHRTRIIDVTQPPYNADNTGATDASAKILQAVAAAVANDVVYLPAGTYRLDTRLLIDHTRDNITIRGAGPGLTILDCRMSNQCFAVGSSSAGGWQPSAGASITGGLAKGSTEVTVGTTAAFQAGQLARIAMVDDQSLPILKTDGKGLIDGVGWWRRQMVRITSKTATTLTVSPALYGDYSATSAVINNTTQQTEGFGIEDLTINGINGSLLYGIFFTQCYGSWVKNVHVVNANNYSVFFLDSLHCELRHSFLDALKNAGSNGAGLLFENSAACLIEDNIIYKSFPLMEINYGSSGNVFAYNFCEDSTSFGAIGSAVNSNHGPHNNFNLYEGNIAPNIQCDGYFGSASHDTVFRNWFHGTSRSATTAPFTNAGASREPILLQRFTRNYSLVANLLGMRSPAGAPVPYHSISGAPAGGPYSFGFPNIGNSNSTGGNAQLSLGDPWADWMITGTLTTRSSNNSGVITLNAGTVPTGAIITIVWSNGQQLDATAGAVAGASVPFSGGNVIASQTRPSLALPAAGTAVQILRGPGGYQEIDLDVAATTIRKENFDVSAGALAAGDSGLGADTLPNSLYRGATKPQWFGDRPWPALGTDVIPATVTSGVLDATATIPNLPAAYQVLPAGYRYVHGEDPPTAPYFLDQPAGTTPANSAVSSGASATFHVAPHGFPVPTLQWQTSANGADWSDISDDATFSGVTTTTLTITTSGALNGRQFRCVATNDHGSSNSSAATLTVFVGTTPVVTSAATASGTYRSVFTSYQITATNPPHTSYNLASGSLPAGVSLNTSTGLISGTPTEAGSFPVTINVSNASGTGPDFVLTLDIAEVTLTVSGVTANNKVYDATTTATLITGGASLVGVLGGDNVTLNVGGASGSFADRHVGAGKTVTVSGLTLGGGSAANYVLTQPSTTASITPKSLTSNGTLAANDKVYNGTTAVLGFSGAAALQAPQAPGAGTTADGKPYTGDDVFLGGAPSGTFGTKTVGAAKAVTVTGLTLTGTDADNYTLVQPTGLTASITAAPLTITGVAASDKVYNGNAAAGINTGGASLVGVIGGDTVTFSGGTGTFADKNVGAGKTVTISGITLGGTDGGNYTLTQPSTTANITQASLTITGVTASNKPYDGLTTATINTGAASLVGVIGADTVTFSGGTGTFADKTVGNAKPVTVVGITLGGADGGNYSLAQPTPTANITAVNLTITGVTANNKTYDGTTTATLDTSGASLVGVIGGDTVTFSGGTGVFANKDVGVGKAVTISGITLGGADGGNYTLTQPAATANITAANLTVNVDANDKVYDKTTVATLDIANAELVGVVGGDSVALDPASYTATFGAATVGAQTVTVTGLALIAGGPAANYSVTQPAGLPADITPKPLSVTGITADDRPYDGTTTATVSGTAALLAAEDAGTGTVNDGRPYNGDAVGVTGTAAGTFDTAAVGTDKTVTLSGLSLGGGDNFNYSITLANTTADITPRALTVSGITVNNRAYDGTTAATFNVGGAALTGVVAGEEANVNVTGATGAFATAAAGVGKPVTVTAVSLGGSAAGNYSATPPVGLTADISTVNLTVTGLVVNDKAFDGNTTATFNTGAATLVGLAPADTGNGNVTIATVTGTFADAAIGNNKSVTVTGLTLGGAAAGNYTVTLPVGITGNINPLVAAPGITLHPIDQTVTEGGDVSFIAAATGTPAPTFQWRKGSSPIAGETGTTLTLTNVTRADAGTYRMVATNSQGSASTNSAQLTVHYAPSITTQPAGQAGILGGEATFTVVADGSPAPGYQWRLNGAAITGATNASYTRTNLQEADAGGYDVVVTNSVGSVTSAVALLAVNPPNYAGTYFGTFEGGGTWALHVRDDNTATYMAYFPDRESAIVLDFIINPDGTFSTSGSEISASGNGSSVLTDRTAGGTPPTAAAGLAFVLSGEIDDDTIAGELAGLGLTLSGSADNGTGPAAGLAGFYTASALGADTGATYSIVGPSGQTLVVTTAEGLVDGATATMGADGQVSLTTSSGGQLVLTVDAEGQTIAASYLAAGSSTPIVFSGVPDTVAPVANLINLSVRAPAGSGDNTLIAGFVVSGTASKSLLIRGIGPTLANFDVANPLADPVLTLYAGALPVRTNDDWAASEDAATVASLSETVGAFALPSGSLDAALLSPPVRGLHSVHVTGKGSSQGVALIELYDSAAGGPARLSNLSARTRVGAGDDVLIAGFVIDGNVPRKLLLRAVGPTLTQFDVAGVLANPKLELFQGANLLHQNDNWGGTAALSAAFGQVGAFELPAGSQDGALLVTLQPGLYSVVVSGVGGSTGVALVEIYEMP